MELSKNAMDKLSNEQSFLTTYQCLDLVLNEYRDYFTAKDLAMVAQVPESLISQFRKGKTNPGVKIFDRIRGALGELSPHAYLRFMSLLCSTDVDLPKIVATAPLHVQGKILSTIAQNNIFQKSSDLSNKQKMFTQTY